MTTPLTTGRTTRSLHITTTPTLAHQLNNTTSEVRARDDRTQLKKKFYERGVQRQVDNDTSDDWGRDRYKKKKRKDKDIDVKLKMEKTIHKHTQINTHD